MEAARLQALSSAPRFPGMGDGQLVASCRSWPGRCCIPHQDPRSSLRTLVAGSACRGLSGTVPGSGTARSSVTEPKPFLLQVHADHLGNVGFPLWKSVLQEAGSEVGHISMGPRNPM